MKITSVALSVFCILLFSPLRAQQGQTTASSPAGANDQGSFSTGFGVNVNYSGNSFSVFQAGDPARFDHVERINVAADGEIYAVAPKLIKDSLAIYLLMGSGKIYRAGVTKGLLGYFNFSGLKYDTTIESADSNSFRKKITGDDLYVLNNHLYVERAGSSKWLIDAPPAGVGAIRDIAVDTLQNVFIATDKGVYTQPIGSSDWTETPALPTPSYLNTIFVDRRQRLYAADTSGHISMSSNFGISWSDQSLPKLGQESIEFAGDAMGDLFAVTHAAGTNFSFTQTLWRLVVGGSGWEQIFLTPNVHEPITINSISADSSFIAATNFGSFVSANKGTSWSPMTGGIPAQRFNGIAAMPGGVLATSTTLGVYYSTKGSKSSTQDWTAASVGGFDYSSQLGIYHAADGSLLTAYQPGYSGMFYFKIYRSTDGKVWSFLDSSTMSSNISGQLKSLYVDQQGTPYIATGQGLWKHASSGWNADTVGMSLKPGYFNNGYVTDVISDGQYLYANVERGAASIMRRPIAGGTWTSDDGSLSLSGRAGSFATDKSHGLHASVGRTILHRDGSGWKVDPIPSAIPTTDGSVNFSFDSSGAMFANFDTAGVYYTTDNGASWHPTWLTSEHVPQAGAYSYEGPSGVYLTSDAAGNTYATTNTFGIYLLKPMLAAGMLFDTTIDLDTVLTGTTSTSFVVTNNGNTNLTISGVTSSDPHFSASTDLNSPLPPGATQAINVDLHAASAGNYSTTLSIASNATLGYSSVRVTAVATGAPQSVASSGADQPSLLISPNPCSSRAIVRSKAGNGGSELRIVDLLGRTILNSLISNGEVESTLDVSSIPSGIYRVELVTENALVESATIAVLH